MKRLFAALIIATFMTAMVPGVTAAETVTEEYFGTAGVRVLDQGRAVSWRPCPPGQCDFTDDGESDLPDLIRMGGGPLTAEGMYINVVVSVSDDIFGSNGAVSACFWNPDGATFNICDEEDYASTNECGSVALTGAPFPSNSVTVWVHTILVTNDLDVCGGWAGTMTGDFF